MSDTFASAGETTGNGDAVANAIPFQGTVVASPMVGEDWELDVEGSPGDARHWHGASGSPIFVHGALAGVLRSVERKVQRRLKAVPIHFLLRDPTFLELTGLKDARDEVETLRRKAIRFLSNSPEVAQATAAELKLTDADPEAIIEASLSHPLNDWLIACDRADCELAEQSNRTYRGSVVELVSLMLPALVAAQVVGLPGPDRAGVLRLDAGTPTLAEILIAAQQHIPTRFRRSNSPRGLGCFIDECPEAGILNDEVESRVLAIREQLWHLVPTDMRTAATAEEKDLRIRKQLELQQDPRNRQRLIYYYLCLKGRPRSEEVGRRLHRRFPELLIASLDARPTDFEHQVIFFLSQLLMRSATVSEV